MRTRKTSIEIDEELLEDARRILGTATLKDTVEAAFLRVLQEQARREEVEALSTMRGMDLADPEVMAAAWRPNTSGSAPGGGWHTPRCR